MIVADYIQVDLNKVQACVIVNSIEDRCFPIIKGKRSTPTPKGTFYVQAIYTHQVQNIFGGHLGNLLIDLGVNPNRPKERIGIHGTSVPHKIGQSLSLGCVRLRNEDIDQLVWEYYFNKIIIK